MIRLRQIALVASDLETVSASITEQLGLDPCYRDPGLIEFGLHNILFPVGDQFIEIVSPVQEGTTAGRLLEKRGGDCGYMALFQTDDLGGTRDRLADAGIRVVYVANGPGITGLHLHPKDVEGAIVSVDEADDLADWPWAGPDWRSHPGQGLAGGITGFAVSVDNPSGTARRWAAALGVVANGTTVSVDDATVSFVSAQGSRKGITSVQLRAPTSGDLSESKIGGVTFVPAPSVPL